VREGKFILGKLITSETNLKELSKLHYGIGNFLTKQFNARLELSNKEKLNVEEKKNHLFYSLFKCVSTSNSSLKVFSNSNIFLWSVIFSYKG